MNLSCNKPITVCAGDTLTITCFTCGMPSSKEWAQKVRSRPTNPLKPYFPFLLQLQPPQGLNLKEDGTTYVCAFCHASLEAQWKNYERQPSDIPAVNRKYNLYKFICAVCGVETYRKRVRTLPFQEFPFLANQRPAGSLTLGNNPLAVVCLDCSETLWAQSAEYDRWGLPIHKRRFNWLARPPPDPDSLEATVARLPSGETQLPRCPPTEPMLKPKDVPTYESGGKYKIRNIESNSGSEFNMSVKKASLISQTNTPVETVGVHSQPPVVTVAPMSTHSTTLSTHKKETLSVPPNMISAQFPKFDPMATQCVQTSQLSQPLFPRSPMFAPSSYGPFPWGTRDDSIGEQYPYPAMDGLQSSSNSAWAWLPPPSTNLIQYQNYVPSSVLNRSYSINDTYYNSGHSYYPPSPESNATTVSAPTNISTHYLPTFTIQNSTSTRSASPPPQAVHEPKSANPLLSSRNSISIPITYDPEISPPIRRGSTSDIKASNQLVQESKKSNMKHSVNANKLSSETSYRTVLPKKLVATSSVHREVNFKSSTNAGRGDYLPVNFKPKSNAIRNHINEKMMHSTLRKVSPNRIYIPNPPCSTHRRTAEYPLQKKWHWQSHEWKHNEGGSLSEFEPMDCSVTGREPLSEPLSEFIQPQAEVANESGSSLSNASDTVIDLSLPAVYKNYCCTNNNSYETSKNKFMIAYLCQSESVLGLNSPKNNSNESMDRGLEVSGASEKPTSGRHSVIITATKSDSSDQLMQLDNDIPSSKRTPNCNNNSSPSNHGSDTKLSDTSDQPKIKIGRAFSSVKHIENSQTQRSVCSQSENSISLETVDNNSKNGSYNSDSNDKFLKGEIVKEYVKKVTSELKKEERQAKHLKRKLEGDQEDFLETLGLVTIRKKSEHELNILIKRSNHNTLPSLKLRPPTPPKVQLGEDFENKILQIAFDDPSLKKCDLSENEVAFLAELDLKPATKSDKHNREVQWRFMLTERMMREKRGAKLCGAKKLWNSDLASSKFHLPAKTLCNNPSLFGSLTVTLPTFLNEGPINTTSTGCSDLLRIAEAHLGSSNVEKYAKIENITVSATCVMRPVISYPKYVPNYVSQTSVSTNVPKVENANDDCTNSLYLNSGPVSSRSGSPDTSSKSLVALNSTGEKTSENIQDTVLSTGEDSRILKVPVVTFDPLNSAGNEENRDELSAVVKGENANSQCPSIIDVIIDADALNCENFVNQVNNILNLFPTPSTCFPKSEGPVARPQSESEWKKLKKYLKSRQSQVKTIEDKLKKREKQILNQLRSCSNNTH